MSVKKLASEAGVNHGLVHYYFGSKEGLVVEAYEHYRRQQQRYASEPCPATSRRSNLLRRYSLSVLCVLHGGNLA